MLEQALELILLGAAPWPLYRVLSISMFRTYYWCFALSANSLSDRAVAIFKNRPPKGSLEHRFENLVITCGHVAHKTTRYEATMTNLSRPECISMVMEELQPARGP